MKLLVLLVSVLAGASSAAILEGYSGGRPSSGPAHPPPAAPSPTAAYSAPGRGDFNAHSNTHPNQGFDTHSNLGFVSQSGQGFNGHASQGFSTQHSQGFTGQTSQGFTGQASQGFTGQTSQGFTGQTSQGFTGQTSQGFPGQTSQGFTGQSSQRFTGQASQGFTSQTSQGFSGVGNEGFSAHSGSQVGRGFTAQTNGNFNAGARDQGYGAPTPPQQSGYPSSNGGQETQCREGEVLHVDGSCAVPSISRKFFVYTSPELPESEGYGQPVDIPPPKVEHNVVFIKTPDQGEGQDPIIVPPPRQENIVYVLNKQTDQGPKVIELPSQEPKSPEVYFVNYGYGETPTLPGGIDFETALASAVHSEGQLIGGATGGPSLEGQDDGFTGAVGGVTGHGFSGAQGGFDDQENVFHGGDITSRPSQGFGGVQGIGGFGGSQGGASGFGSNNIRGEAGFGVTGFSGNQHSNQGLNVVIDHDNSFEDSFFVDTSSVASGSFGGSGASQGHQTGTGSPSRSYNAPNNNINVSGSLYSAP